MKTRTTATCKKCGRPLTDPVSVACGLGPECRGAGRTAARTVRPSRRTDRTNAWINREPITTGKDTRTGNTNTYIYDPQTDRYTNQANGSTISSENLEAYLKRYGYIHTNSVANLQNPVRTSEGNKQ